jgi:hypothetical protein
MCTGAELLIGSQLAGGGMAGVGAYRTAKLNRAAYDYQAGLEDAQARDALERGQDAEARHKLAVGQLAATQRTGFAARGVAADEGSALDVLTSTEFMGALDAAAIRANAEKESWSHKSNAAMLRYRSKAENPAQAALGSLLGSTGQVAQSWYYLTRTTRGGS